MWSRCGGWDLRPQPAQVCVRYAAQRRQFGAPIGAFQLVQERLVRMNGNVQVRSAPLCSLAFGRALAFWREGGKEGGKEGAAGVHPAATCGCAAGGPLGPALGAAERLVHTANVWSEAAARMRCHPLCTLCSPRAPWQAMFLMAWRLSKLHEEGRMTHEQVRCSCACACVGTGRPRRGWSAQLRACSLSLPPRTAPQSTRHRALVTLPAARCACERGLLAASHALRARRAPPQASLVKAWTTLRGREVMALGRELLGGNGILTDFNVAKVRKGHVAVLGSGRPSRGRHATRVQLCHEHVQAMNDLEAYHTYEGTYDINVLVAGRGITGISAIKPATKAGPRARL